MNIIFLNGVKVNNYSQISLINPSFLYGINCFEGIRAYWCTTKDKLLFFDLQQHLCRLYNSSRQLGFNSPIVIDDLESMIYKIIANESIQEHVYIRITFFISSDTSWYETENISYIISIRSISSELNNENSIKLGFSKYRRISNNSMPPSVKAGANYLNSRYALLDCKAKGFDGAIFLNKNDFISESTGSCIFFIKNNTLFTPSKDADILESITRNRIIQLALGADIEICEKLIRNDEIDDFDSAFLVGTMIEVKAIFSIETKKYDIHHPLLIRVVNLLYDYLYK